MTAAYLKPIYGDSLPAGLAVVQRNRRNWEAILRIARTRLNSPATSSVGRLFDAAAAIFGIRDRVNHEGQAAVELEQAASVSIRDAYPVTITGDGPMLASGADIIQAVVDDLRAGREREIIAARFHNALVRVITDVCEAIRQTRGLSLVALSGGVFQNELPLSRAVNELRLRRFHVLTHSRVPPSDGGISVGRVAVAAALAHAG